MLSTGFRYYFCGESRLLGGPDERGKPPPQIFFAAAEGLFLMEAPATVRRRRIDSGFPGGPRNKTGALPGRSRRETAWESGFPSPACGRFRRGTEGYSLCRSGRSTAADNPFGNAHVR